METPQETALAQMRKSVQKLGLSTEKFGDLTLMRFLVARSMDADKAAEMFVQWVKWRESFVPSGVIHDSEVKDELEQQKIYFQGLSKKGHPVFFVRACNHFPNKDHLQFKTFKSFYRVAGTTCLNILKLDCVEFVVYMLDKAFASSSGGHEVGNEKLITIVDLWGLSYKNVDRRAFTTGFQLVQAYYPERLEKCFMINMPRFFVSIWRIISRFLDKATLEKIKIVNSEDEKEDLINEVGAAVLPEMCGGKAKLTLLQDVKLAPCQEVTP